MDAMNTVGRQQNASILSLSEVLLKEPKLHVCTQPDELRELFSKCWIRNFRLLRSNVPNFICECVVSRQLNDLLICERVYPAITDTKPNNAATAVYKHACERGAALFMISLV